MVRNWRPLSRTISAAGVLGLLCYARLHLLDASSRRASTSIARPIATSTLSSPDGPVPPAIHATVRRGPVTVALTVAPVDVGTARFRAGVWVGGHVLSGGRVRFTLAMPAQPVFPKTVIVATACHGGYCGQGQLPALGRWHLDTLVCPPRQQRGCARIPFDFMNGANASFLFAQPPDMRFGSASVILTRVPQDASTLRLRLRPGLTVRALVAMPNMLSMGAATYAAWPQTHGWYGISLLFPMTGVTRITLQVRTAGGWLPVRTLLYDVDSAGNAELITATVS